MAVKAKRATEQKHNNFLITIEDYIH
jgi:hypothetical protein